MDSATVSGIMVATQAIDLTHVREKGVQKRHSARVVKERPQSMAQTVKSAFAHTYQNADHTRRVPGTCDRASSYVAAARATECRSLAYAPPRPVQQREDSWHVQVGQTYAITLVDGGIVRHAVALVSGTFTMRPDQTCMLSLADRGHVHLRSVHGVWHCPSECWGVETDWTPTTFVVYMRGGTETRVFALAPEELASQHRNGQDSTVVSQGDVPALPWGQVVGRQIPRLWTQGKGIQQGGSMSLPNCQVSRTSRSGIMRHGARGSRGRRTT